MHVIGTYCKNPKGCSGIGAYYRVIFGFVISYSGPYMDNLFAVLMADDALFSEACCSLCNTTFCSKVELLSIHSAVAYTTGTK